MDKKNLRSLVNWRKGKPVIHNGQMLHYLPKESVYVYFRFNEKENIMVILNNNDAEKPFKTDHYREGLKGASKGLEVISGKNIEDLASLKIPAHSAMVIELK